MCTDKTYKQNSAYNCIKQPKGRVGHMTCLLIVTKGLYKVNGDMKLFFLKFGEHFHFDSISN